MPRIWPEDVNENRIGYVNVIDLMAMQIELSAFFSSLVAPGRERNWSTTYRTSVSPNDDQTIDATLLCTGIGW